MSSTARNTIAVGTVQDITDAVRSAAKERKSLTASRHVIGTTCRLDLSSMNRVVDYPARDMTVTVEAGITLRVLSDLLRTEGQQLPVDIADPDMTAGAFVASDLAGPRQYGYGTLRDYLIGMEAVDGQGRIFHAGGRVVKNVAGYDLCRLMVGSRGLLGILSQITFKLKPVPEHFLVQRWQFAQETQVTASLDSLNLSAARPVVIDLQSSDSRNWSLCVGVDGPSDVCNWQLEQLHQNMSHSVSSELLAANNTTATVYCEDIARRHLAPNTLGVIRTVPSRVTDVCCLIHKFGLATVCHAGNGVIVVCRGDSESLPDRGKEQIQELLSGTHVCFRFATDDTRLSRPRNPFSTGLIEAFDPHRLFV